MVAGVLSVSLPGVEDAEFLGAADEQADRFFLIKRHLQAGQETQAPACKVHLQTRDCPLDHFFTHRPSEAPVSDQALRSVVVTLASGAGKQRLLRRPGPGLAIAKTSVERHGTIRAESAGLGWEATFRVELAGDERHISMGEGGERQTPAAAVPASPAAALSAASSRVLLVEDHEATLQVLARLLTRAGYTVTTAIHLGEGAFPPSYFSGAARDEKEAANT